MQDSGSAEQDEHPLEGEGGEEDEYSDEDECFSQDSFEHNDVIASDEDEHSDQVKGNIMLAPPTLLTHGVKQHPLECSGPDCKASVEEAEANEEAPEEARDAEVDERSSHRSTAEYHDVMGSEAEADEAKHSFVVRSILFTAMRGAARRLLEKKDFKELDTEEHLDAPSTGPPSSEEGEDSDNSASDAEESSSDEYSDEYSDEEYSDEYTEDEVGGPHEEAPDCDDNEGPDAGVAVGGGSFMKREAAFSCKFRLEDPLWSLEVPVAVKTDASRRPASILLARDAAKPRPKKTVRFSEHVDHRSISPRPRSASTPQSSATDTLRGKKSAAQAGMARSSASKPSAAAKPVPVQSSSFSEFLFLPPVPENKTEPPPRSLSKFLFGTNGSTAQHVVPAVEMESSSRSGEAHHPSSTHHNYSDAHRQSTGDHHHRSDDALDETASARTSSSSSGEPESPASCGEVSGTIVHSSSSSQAGCLQSVAEVRRGSEGLQ